MPLPSTMPSNTTVSTTVSAMNETAMTTSHAAAGDDAAFDFAELGLFDELHDAQCVELFADAFRDAEHLDNGDQVILQALADDWWAEDLAAVADPAESETPVKVASHIALPPAFVPPATNAVAAPVANRNATASAGYKSLTAQIAIVAPSFNAAFAPGMAAAEAVPAPAAGAAATIDVAAPCEMAMHEMDTKARRQLAIARWKEKRKRRTFGEKHRFPEYDCRRKVANRRPRVNGRFIREQPVYVSISELQATYQL